MKHFEVVCCTFEIFRGVLRTLALTGHRRVETDRGRERGIRAKKDTELHRGETQRYKDTLSMMNMERYRARERERETERERERERESESEREKERKKEIQSEVGRQRPEEALTFDGVSIF